MGKKLKTLALVKTALKEKIDVSKLIPEALENIQSLDYLLENPEHVLYGIEQQSKYLPPSQFDFNGVIWQQTKAFNLPQWVNDTLNPPDKRKHPSWNLKTAAIYTLPIFLTEIIWGFNEDIQKIIDSLPKSGHVQHKTVTTSMEGDARVEAFYVSYVLMTDGDKRPILECYTQNGTNYAIISYYPTVKDVLADYIEWHNNYVKSLRESIAEAMYVGIGINPVAAGSTSAYSIRTVTLAEYLPDNFKQNFVKTLLNLNNWYKVSFIDPHTQRKREPINIVNQVIYSFPYKQLLQKYISSYTNHYNQVIR